MTSIHDFHDKIETIDKEIIRLLADRSSLCQEALEEDPEVMGPEFQAEVVERYDVASDEHSWNVAAAMRIVKGINDICKPVE